MAEANSPAPPVIMVARMVLLIASCGSYTFPSGAMMRLKSEDSEVDFNSIDK